jgi:hypothetical protein
MGTASRRKRDRSGILHSDQHGKTIQLDGELAEAIREQHAAFVRKFGREPGPDDPVFFDPDENTPQPIKLQEFHKSMLELMSVSGMRPEIIYAFEKTGRIVTRENMKFLTDADLAEWDSAIAEYHEQVKDARA